MKKVIDELDKIRRESGVRGKKAKKLILKNREDLNEEEEKLDEYLNRSKRLRQAYEAEKTVEEGKRQMEEWISRAKKIYSDAVKTVRNHIEGICQYFSNRSRQRRLGAVTSGIMEGINNRIKLIKRQGYGFTNMANFRARLLAAFWP